jgi:tetratricopeptide (TPR) repeat protein
MFQQRARAGRLGATPTLEIYGRRFSLAETEEILQGNRTLLRAAVMHADIAVLGIEDDFSRQRTTSDGGGTISVADGLTAGVRYETAHWTMGRSLLDLMTAGPTGDADALLWYRAASAYLLREGDLPEARVHLEKARQIFPGTGWALVDSGYLYEQFSSPQLQAAAESFRSEGGTPAIGSRNTELERAARYFEQALALERDNLEAHLRLGHALQELKQYDQARTELHRVIDLRPRGAQLYFAELFLGRVEHALGHADQARIHYENAAELYPDAQSPWLSLSLLARQSGDRSRALHALRGVTTLTSSEIRRFDPWWEYYEVHNEDGDRLLEQMRGLAGAKTP